MMRDHDIELGDYTPRSEELLSIGLNADGIPEIPLVNNESLATSLGPTYIGLKPKV